MCLIMTTFAAIIASCVWYFKLSDRKYKLGLLSLMYWGASIMWFVDGIYSVIDGGDFFNLSVDDALLGLVIIAIGLIAWLVLLLINDPKNVFSPAKKAKSKKQN